MKRIAALVMIGILMVGFTAYASTGWIRGEWRSDLELVMTEPDSASIPSLTASPVDDYTSIPPSTASPVDDIVDETVPPSTASVVDDIGDELEPEEVPSTPSDIPFTTDEDFPEVGEAVDEEETIDETQDDGEPQ